jgi:elongation factor Ts
MQTGPTRALTKLTKKKSRRGKKMAVDINEIKRLKELTGVGLTDAKAALEEAGGDFDKALEAMRKKGMTKAEKRGEREARAGLVGTYNHDSRIGVIVEVNCETDFVARNDIFVDLVKDIAMHIAASNPEYVSSDEIPAEAAEKVRAEMAEKAKADGKPADMIEKIVDGQVKKYFAERCLLDQPFIKNPDQTVGDLVKEHNARLGENVVVRRFARIALGEVA